MTQNQIWVIFLYMYRSLWICSNGLDAIAWTAKKGGMRVNIIHPLGNLVPELIWMSPASTKQGFPWIADFPSKEIYAFD